MRVVPGGIDRRITEDEICRGTASPATRRRLGLFPANPGVEDVMRAARRRPLPEGSLWDMISSKSFRPENLPKSMAEKSKGSGPVFRPKVPGRRLVVLAGLGTNRRVSRKGRLFRRTTGHMCRLAAAPTSVEDRAGLELQISDNLLLIACHLVLELVARNFHLKLSPLPKISPDRKLEFRVTGYRHPLGSAGKSRDIHLMNMRHSTRMLDRKAATC